MRTVSRTPSDRAISAVVATVLILILLVGLIGTGLMIKKNAEPHRFEPLELDSFDSTDIDIFTNHTAIQTAIDTVAKRVPAPPPPPPPPQVAQQPMPEERVEVQIHAQPIPAPNQPVEIPVRVPAQIQVEPIPEPNQHVEIPANAPAQIQAEPIPEQIPQAEPKGKNRAGQVKGSSPTRKSPRNHSD